MKGFCMAVMATVAPLLAVAPQEPVQSYLDGKHQTVKCAAAAKPVEVTVSVPDTTVIVECQSGSQFDPAVTGSAEQTVYDDAGCTAAKKLSSVCPSVSVEALKNKKTAPGKTGATLTIKTLPPDNPQVCFVQCKPPGEVKRDGPQTCVVQVTVKQATQAGTQDQAGAAGQAGGVHICAQPGGSISVSLPDKESSVRFRCAEKFVLYPIEPEKVFKDDCKTEENLKNMTRTQAAAATPAVGTLGGGATAASPITFTLTADTKPQRKRLCYLCAEQKASGKAAKPGENYCAIYVESSALTKSHLHVAPWALAPLCVFALLRIS